MVELIGLRETWNQARTKTNAMAELANTLEDALNRKDNFQITVGAAGIADFTTLNAAIAEARRYREGYKSKGVTIDIHQLSGFEMAEQVFAVQTDLSFLTLTSQDPVVPIRRAALNSGFGGSRDNNWRVGMFPALVAMRKGALPFIKALWEMDEDNAATVGLSSKPTNGYGTVGIYVFENSAAVIGRGYGVKRAGWRGLYVDGGFAYARASVWSGAGFAGGVEGTAAGIRGSNGAFIMGRQAIATGCRDGAFLSGARGIFSEADFSDAQQYGLVAQASAHVSGTAPKADRCGAAGFRGSDGAKLDLLSDSNTVDGVTTYIRPSAQGCVGPAILLDGASKLTSAGGDFTSTSTHAVQVSGDSEFSLPAANIKSFAGRGVSFAEGSRGNLFGATVEGTGDAAVRSFNGGSVNLVNAKLKGGSTDLNLSGGTIAVVSASTTRPDGSAITSNVNPGEFSTAGMILGRDKAVLLRSTDASFTLGASDPSEVVIEASFSQGRNITLPDPASVSPSKEFNIHHVGSGSGANILDKDGVRRFAIAVGESISLRTFPPRGETTPGGWTARSTFRRPTVRRAVPNGAFTVTPTGGRFVTSLVAITQDRIGTMYDAADAAAMAHVFTRRDGDPGRYLLQEPASNGGALIAAVGPWETVEVAPLPPDANGAVAGWYVVARSRSKPAAGTTAARPAIANVEVGFAYFDTSLNKPIWSDGTGWRDAAGVAV